MQRRVSLGNLRGMDPVTLEVTITEALRRPLSQLDAAALVDLMALADADDAPKGLRRSLVTFKERMVREISDLPDGHVWKEWMDEIGELEVDRVGQGLRDLLTTVARAEGRAAATVTVLEPLEARWAESPSVPFPIGGGTRRVEKHEVMNSSEPLMSKRSIRIANDRKKPARKRRTAGAGGGGAPNRRAAPPSNPIDRDKLDFLLQTCLDRLAQYGDKGLAEPILLVGVRKKAEVNFPGTSGRDVQTALKQLEDTGQVKRSAGRWMIKPRW